MGNLNGPSKEKRLIADTHRTTGGTLSLRSYFYAFSQSVIIQTDSFSLILLFHRRDQNSYMGLLIDS